MPYFKAALSLRVSQAIADRSICLIDPYVEDQFAFHQRKGEERDFPQGNAEGRDSGARESWLEDERASWVICVFVGRLDFLYNIVFPICCPVGCVAFGFLVKCLRSFANGNFRRALQLAHVEALA